MKRILLIVSILLVVGLGTFATAMVPQPPDLQSKQGTTVDRRVPGLLPRPQKVEWGHAAKAMEAVYLESKIKTPSNDVEFTINKLKKILNENKVVLENQTAFGITLELDISKFTRKQIQAVEDWINNYPRKILGFATAEEMFIQELCL